MTAATAVEPKARHGRREARMLWARAAPALDARAGEAGTHQAPWPHLARVCRVRRRRVDVRTGEVEAAVGYAVTSLPPQRAAAARPRALRRGRWGIEDELRHVGDATFGEDRSAVRTGAAPQACAACRHPAVALPRRAGAANVAAACRTFAGRPPTAIALAATARCRAMK